jgi:hypothetical protein
VCAWRGACFADARGSARGWPQRCVDAQLRRLALTATRSLRFVALVLQERVAVQPHRGDAHGHPVRRHGHAAQARSAAHCGVSALRAPARMGAVCSVFRVSVARLTPAARPGGLLSSRASSPQVECPVLPYEPVLCKGCRAALNPYCQCDYHNKTWTCPFCFSRNHFPAHYSQISDTNLPGARGGAAALPPRREDARRAAVA